MGGLKNKRLLKYLMGFVFAILIFGFNLCAEELEIKNGGISLFGTLIIPKTDTTGILCVIVPGSGPTNRDGNSTFNIMPESYKLLAEALLQKNIASFRYDKRGVGKSVSENLKEEDIRFETNVEDLAVIITRLKQFKQFKKIFLIGHSEGSLVCILCAQKENVDGIISVAGAGKNAGDLILEQIEKNPANPDNLKKATKNIIKDLKKGNINNNVPPVLNILFRKSIQPYLISWFKYEPVSELAKLTIPFLVIQGGSDLQVGIEDAKLLASAKTGIELKLIEKMTHTLKEINSFDEMLKTYIDPSYPLAKELVPFITGFIEKSVTSKHK